MRIFHQQKKNADQWNIITQWSQSRTFRQTFWPKFRGTLIHTDALHMATDKKHFTQEFTTKSYYKKSSAYTRRVSNIELKANQMVNLRQKFLKFKVPYTHRLCSSWICALLYKLLSVFPTKLYLPILLRTQLMVWVSDGVKILIKVRFEFRFWGEAKVAYLKNNIFNGKFQIYWWWFTTLNTHFFLHRSVDDLSSIKYL